MSGQNGQNERITEAQRRVVDFLARHVPPGSRRIDLRCCATVAVNDLSLSVLTEDGKTVAPEAMPPELAELMMELRRAHYLPEQGTWFSARFVLEPGAPIRPLFNYDFDPGWDPPIAAEYWQRDQIVMPRDGAHVPGWLQDRLDGREPAYGPVVETDPLNPIEQMELLSNEFCVLVAEQAPPLWDTVFGYYQVAGDHAEFPAAMVQRADRTMLTWTLPPAARVLLDRLRAGTYGFQGGTWSRIDYRVLHENGSARVQAKFTHDEEPAWNAEPSAHDVRLEVERFPEHRSRDWVRRRLEAAGAAAETGGPRPAPAPAPDAEAEAEARRAGGVRKARVFDHVEPDGGRPSVSRPAVPRDEVERLVEYLRGAPVVMAARSSAPDQIDPSRGDRVPLTFHTDGAWVWPGSVGYYLAEHGVPPEPDLVAHARAAGFRIPEVGDDALDAASAAITGRSAPPRVHTGTGAPPPAPQADPPPPPAPLQARAVAGRLEGRLDELGVPSGAYRINEVADGAWSLVAESGRWAVFRGENGGRSQEVVFDTEAQASAYLLGSLLLDPAVRAVPAVPPAAPGGTRPIEPLTGEPPLTLFRDRRQVEVPAGTLVDRYGDDGGNVTYAVRTPFEERSLPPDWENRPYRVYRLRRPLRALTGVAVPWFEQPGGGTAYVFERSVADLLADGAVVAVPEG
ncbi:TNT domain-containing protein [Actinomadura viridis]|uniref:TNT domain-containing protein n=1 Tax=Actinomadura viridis TaxID=58110 RepID=UPI00368097BA